MNLKTKLEKLATLQDTVLYRWSAGRSRLAGDYILLSNLRLNVLSCSGGRVVLSCAAPVVYMDHGRSVMRMSDRGVFTIVDGARKGINVLAGFLKEGEKAVQAQFCRSVEITDDRQPKWVADKVLSMGCSPVYPVIRILVPDLFRITRKPETLRPLYTSAVLKAIGGCQSDTPEGLLEKFRSHLSMFGTFTDDGYVIPNDRIAAGGCCVAASRGISARAGSPVHMMPLCSFADEAESHGWSIATARGEEEEDDVE